MQIKNRPSTKEKRRKLRKSQTETENLLWAKIRGQQINGFRFLRQYSIDEYILDFYCPKLRLAIELDGGQHVHAVLYDRERDSYLERLGIHVVRFWNQEVKDSIEIVIARIKSLCSPPSTEGGVGGGF